MMPAVAVRRSLAATTGSTGISGRALAAAVAVIALLAGCGSAPDPGTDHDRPGTGSATVDPRELDCERDGFPCDWSSADRPATVRAAELAEGADGQLADGRSPQEVAAWLLDDRDVDEALAGPHGVRFRVAATRPVWVLTDEAFGPVPPGSDTGASGVGADPAERRVRAASLDIVGTDPEDKRALVVAPYAWQLAAHSRRADIVATLEDARGYDGNVDVLADEERSRGPLDPSAFAGWGDYDVVHVTRHGAQLCSHERCFSAVSGGLIGDTVDADAIADWAHRSDGSGAGFAIKDGRYHAVYPTDWFRTTYPGGLDDTIVWFNACQLAKGDDLSAALTADGGVFFGWTDIVRIDDADDAALAFYRYLSETGFPTRRAVEELTGDVTASGSETALPEVRSWELEDGDWLAVGRGYAQLERRGGSPDLRIRETVELQHPDTGDRLRDADVATVDTDGDATRMPVRIQVDGVHADDVASITVSLETNGTEVLRTGLTAPPDDLSVERVDDDSYLVRGSAELPPDAASGRMTLRAAVDPLPEEGHTEHEVAIDAFACRFEVRWDGAYWVDRDDYEYHDAERFTSSGHDLQVRPGDEEAAGILILDPDHDLAHLPGFSIDTGWAQPWADVTADPPYRFSLEFEEGTPMGETGTFTGTAHLVVEDGDVDPAWGGPVEVTLERSRAAASSLGGHYVDLLVGTLSGTLATSAGEDLPRYPQDESPLSGAEPEPAPAPSTDTAQVEVSFAYTFSGCS